MYYLIAIYLIFFAFLAHRRTDWAIYLIIFALPSYLIRFNLVSLPMTLLEGMILILFFIWLIKTLMNKETSKLFEIFNNNKLLFILSDIFLIVATVSVFVSPHLREALGIWKAYFIEPFLFLIVFVSAINKDKLKNIFSAFALSASLLSLIAIYQKITGNLISNPFWADEATRRVTGIFEYPNALSLLLAPILILLIGYLFQLQNRPRIYQLFIFLSILLNFFAIAFTKSKGAILALYCGLIFYAIFYKPYRKYFIILILIISLTAPAMLATGKIDINLRGQATVEGGDSISVRLDMWNETWQMLESRPIFGAGLAGYQTAVGPYHNKKYIEVFLYPHNIFLNFWTELGLLGLISFLLLVFWFYRQGFKNKSYILLSAMTVIIIHGLVDVPYFKNDLSVFFWFLFASMIIATTQEVGRTREIC